MEKTKPKIIGVILAYNVARLLPRAVARIPQGALDDVIVMDDGSKDGTAEVAQKLGLKVFRHVPNRGYGRNLQAGLKQALELGADYVVEIHGDGAQFNPVSILYAADAIQQRAQLILGSRFQEPRQALRNGMSLPRFIANRFLSFFDRIVLGLPLTEFHTGFRIYGKQLLETVPYTENANGYLFSFQIIAQAAYYNLPVTEVPVEADYNSDHSSVPMKIAAWYAVQTFVVLGQYLLAKTGIAYCKIFPQK